MLSVDYIRENKQKVIDSAKNKNREIDVESILKLDEERKNSIHKIQKLREERNIISHGKNVAKAASGEPRTGSNPERGKTIKDELKKLESQLLETETKLKLLLLQVPNVPLDGVPLGKDEKDNRQQRTWGKVPKFSFTPKTHIQLGEDLDLLDTVRGSKVSGYRGYFLKNELAQLHIAVLMFAYQKLIKAGFTPLIAPALVKSFALEGTAQFPWGKDEVYELNDKDSFLSGTSEVPVTAFHSGEILNEKDLPKKYVALSPCYRKEAGSYGKDTKGLYRVHEFWKIEQVVLSKNDPKEGMKIHSELLKNAEEILQDLELPYEVMLMCTGDMGEPQQIKEDINTWMPSRNNYSETMSNSLMGDFQARRLDLKYRTKENKTQFCYTLNNTCVASPRILIALLENHQQEDGSVKIPKALQPFTGFSEIRKK